VTERTASTTVATNAQKKLLHIVFIGKLEDISSSENKTPPIGLPKATATPAAEHAENTSLVLAVPVSSKFPGEKRKFTSIHLILVE
jgi:hypothetical protein